MFLYTPSIERAYFDMRGLALVFNRQDLKELASMGCARDGGDCLFAYG